MPKPKRTWKVTALPIVLVCSLAVVSLVVFAPERPATVGDRVAEVQGVVVEPRWPFAAGGSAPGPAATGASPGAHATPPSAATPPRPGVPGPPAEPGPPASTPPPRPEPRSFPLGGDVEGLYPGATLGLEVRISNPFRFAVEVTSIAVTATGSEACPGSVLTVDPLAGPITVAALDSTTTTLTIRMAGDAPDACQGATWDLTYDATAVMA